MRFRGGDVVRTDKARLRLADRFIPVTLGVVGVVVPDAVDHVGEKHRRSIEVEYAKDECSSAERRRVTAPRDHIVALVSAGVGTGQTGDDRFLVESLGGVDTELATAFRAIDIEAFLGGAHESVRHESHIRVVWARRSLA